MTSIGVRLSALLLAALALAGCRAEEQNRVLDYEPGVYLGPQDQEIDDETREALKRRTKLQSF